MNCIWREHARGFYHCKNCKLPASKTKQWLKGLPPSRNCQNPEAQFLLGDFLASVFSRFSPEFQLRWGKRIDWLMGMETKTKNCACAYRQKVLNDWTLRVVSVSIWRRPWVIITSLGQLSRHILRLAPIRANKG